MGNTKIPSQELLITPEKPFSKSINTSSWVKLLHLFICLAFMAIALGICYVSLELGRVFMRNEVHHAT